MKAKNKYKKHHKRHHSIDKINVIATMYLVLSPSTRAHLAQRQTRSMRRRTRRSAGRCGTRFAALSSFLSPSFAVVLLRWLLVRCFGAPRLRLCLLPLLLLSLSSAAAKRVVALDKPMRRSSS